MLSSFALLLLAAASADGAVVERVLADVAGEPVLLSEVRLVSELKGLALPAALEAALDARLMYREAARLPQASLSAGEAKAACDQLKLEAPSWVDDPALCALGQREAVILKYVAFRFAPEVREATGDATRSLDERIEAWAKELREANPVRYNAAP